MDLEQRLEGIAQNLDTLTRIHLDNDREYRERFDKMSVEFDERFKRMSDRFDRMSAEYEKRFQRDEQRLAQVMDAMNRLITIVESHEQRLDDLERGR